MDKHQLEERTRHLRQAHPELLEFIPRQQLLPLRGWLDLLDRTLHRIEAVSKKHGAFVPQLRLLRRQDSGRLLIRFAHGTIPEVLRLARHAETESESICVHCGEDGFLRQLYHDHWLSLCDDCAHRLINDLEIWGYQYAVEKQDRNKDATDDDTSGADDEAYLDGPAHLVLRAAPTPSSHREEQEMMKRFTALTRPVPLATLSAEKLDDLLNTLEWEFPWMHEVTRLLGRQLRMQLACGSSVPAFQPLLLTGSPGTGKTRYARRLAELLDVPFALIAVGGSTDNRALAGTARGWSSAQPSQIIQLISRHRLANPLFLLDELDKEAESRRNGRITDTLHQLLEPGNAAYWEDEFLLTSCDLSRVLWIATANETRRLRASLLSRFRVIEVEAPRGDALLPVIHGARKELAARLNVPETHLPPLDEAEWAFLAKRCHASTPPSPRLLARLTEELLARKLEAPASAGRTH